MARKPHSKPPTRKRLKPPSTVELHYPRNTFDTATWLSSYNERLVEREVHLLADRAPPTESSSSPASKQVSDKTEEAPDSAV